MTRFTDEDLARITAQKGYSPVASGLHHPKPERPAREEPLDSDQDQGRGKGRTVLIITRWAPKRLDCDNLYGGVKPLVDALRYNGRIEDDDPDSIQLIVRQKKCKKADQGTEILILTPS